MAPVGALFIKLTAMFFRGKIHISGMKVPPEFVQQCVEIVLPFFFHWSFFPLALLLSWL